MEHRFARDFISRLWRGTLYERLAAAADLADDATRAAEEWNEYAAILHAFGRGDVTGVDLPKLDFFELQKQILTLYADHPLLGHNQPLKPRVEAADPRLADLISTAPRDRALREAAYIDQVRCEVGALPPAYLAIS